MANQSIWCFGSVETFSPKYKSKGFYWESCLKYNHNPFSVLELFCTEASQLQVTGPNISDIEFDSGFNRPLNLSHVLLRISSQTFSWHAIVCIKHNKGREITLLL